MPRGREKANLISIGVNAGVKSGYSHPELKIPGNGVRFGLFHTPNFIHQLSGQPVRRKKTLIPHRIGEGWTEKR